MKIVSWNINGIRAIAKKGFFEFFERENPDIFCLQETKAQKEQLDTSLIFYKDYKSYWSSAERKGYSGVATYSKWEADEVQLGLGWPEYDREGRILITEIEDVLIYNIYFPNGSSSEDRHNYKQLFLRKLNDHLKAEIKQGKKIVVVGDYNVAHQEIDVFDPKGLAQTSGFLPEERQWFSEFLSLGFVDSYRYFFPDRPQIYTWWSYREMARVANRGWRLDYICVTENLKSKMESVAILSEQEGSDHCPVVLTLKVD